MARDESRDVDRKRAATGLVRALARPQRSCLVWACPAQLLGGWLGRCGAGANHGAGQGARDEHARQRSGARPRVVQTDTLHAPGASDSSEAAKVVLSQLRSGMTLLLVTFCLWNPLHPANTVCLFSKVLVVYLEPDAAAHERLARYGARLQVREVHLAPS